MFAFGHFSASVPSLVGTFDPANKAATVTLSNGNLTMASSANASAVKSTTSCNAGSVYFEVVIDAIGSNASVGVSNSAVNVSAGAAGAASGGVSYGNSGAFFQNGAQNGSGATFTAGDVIGVELTFGTGLRFYKNNVAQGTGVLAMPTGPLLIHVSGNASTQASLKYVPVYNHAGFTYWGN